MSIGAEVSDCRNRGTELGPLQLIKYKMANKLVFSKLKAKIGLDQARICVSGAAPIAAEVLQFLGQSRFGDTRGLWTI